MAPQAAGVARRVVPPSPSSARAFGQSGVCGRVRQVLCMGRCILDGTEVWGSNQGKSFPGLRLQEPLRLIYNVLPFGLV